MASIDFKNLSQVKRMYYKQFLSMREIAKRFGVSIDAVVYFMRKHNLPKHDFSKVNQIRFERKEPSLKRRNNLTSVKELMAIWTMLY